MNINNFLNLLTSNKWVIMVILILLLLLIIYISIIIDDHFGGVHNFIITTYLIYMPIGLFMAIYYLWIYKDWFSRDNTYTLAFVFYSAVVIFEFLTDKLIKRLKLERYNYRNPNRRYAERAVNRAENSKWVLLILFAIIVPYTLYGFISLLLNWLF